MAEQPQESWWIRRKNAKAAQKESDKEVYESHPSWKEYRKITRKHSFWSVPLACFFVMAPAWAMSRDGLGFGQSISDRMGSNLLMIGMLWVLMAIILVHAFRSFSLSSYSKGFRDEASNLMARTANSDPEKRWDTAQLVKHLGAQLSEVPQDGVILVNIIQMERYSLTALIDAAERAKEEQVLKVILKFERLNHWVNSALFVASAVFSAFACRGILLLVKNLSGKDPLIYIGLVFCLAAVSALAWAIYKGQDPEKLVGALVKVFVGCALVVGGWLGYIKLVDVLKEYKNPDAGKSQEPLKVLPKPDTKNS